jgi:hypothetical protein
MSSGSWFVMWDREQAIELCRRLNPIAMRFGCHVALTGGLLYKDGKRKDCDIVVYRRGLDKLPQGGRKPFNEEIDRTAMVNAMVAEAELYLVDTYTRVVKLFYKDVYKVDLVFPECDGSYIDDAKTAAGITNTLLVPGDAA